MKIQETALDRELDGLQVLIMKMGGLVESSILGAARALEDRDLDLAVEMRAQDKQVDALEDQINEECARIITERAPISRDLRLILSIMKISGNLERCGDYAKNMAKRTTVLVEMEPVSGAPRALRNMAQQIEGMLRDALDAYARRDAALAADVRQRDEDVDQMYNALFRELLTHMMEDPRNITACMHLHFIAKNIERAGDHVTAIAEQVIYLVTGELPEDERPKGDRTSFASPEV
jgi:phosphate transport system protein